MGVGKTVQALGLACVYKKDWPVLILTPGYLREQWKDEVQRWLKDEVFESEIQLMVGQKDHPI